MNPVTNYLDYDSFKLAGVRSPGVCTFPQVPERIEGWQQQVPSGGSGGFTVHKRTPPIEFDVEVYVWVGEDEYGAPVDGFAEFEKFVKLFKTPIKSVISRSSSNRAQAAFANALSVANDPNASPGAKLDAEHAAQNAAQAARNSARSQALAWSHPLTDKLDPPVSSVVIGKWSMPKPDGLGGGTARIHFEEYRPLIVQPIVTPLSTHTEKTDYNADKRTKLEKDSTTLDAVKGPRR